MPELSAMVLGAGLGTRLQPLTSALPKPLVPVLGVPLLRLSLELVARAGARLAAINLHHLPQLMRAEFDPGRPEPPLPIQWFEEPTLLGTGGGLANARSAFGRSDLVLLVNGDTLFDADLGALVEAHRSSKAAATLLVRENPDPRAFPPVETDEGMRVWRIAGQPAPPTQSAARELKPWLFAGVHVLEPHVLELLPPGVSDINRVLHPQLIARGERVQAVRHQGLWSDIGTPARLLAATGELLRRPPAVLLALARAEGYQLEAGVAWGSEVARSKAISASVIGHGVRIGSGAEVHGSLVFPGTEIGAGALVRHAVLGPGAQIAAGERIEHEILALGARRSIAAEEGLP